MKALLQFSCMVSFSCFTVYLRNPVVGPCMARLLGLPRGIQEVLLAACGVMLAHRVVCGMLEDE